MLEAPRCPSLPEGSFPCFNLGRDLSRAVTGVQTYALSCKRGPPCSGRLRERRRGGQQVYRVSTSTWYIVNKIQVPLDGRVMRAYIVVATESGRSRDVARHIAGLPGVKMADACWGSRDVFAVVEVGGSQQLNDLVMDQIQGLIGVKETSTHIALD